MKKHNLNTWSLILVFGFFWISLSSFSQETKMNSQERKEARKAQMAANFDALKNLVETRNFVLKADYLENRYGDMVPVSSNINFILINSSNGIIQTGSNSRIGYNGLGGVTAEGTISSWEVVKNNKNLTYTIKFSLLTNVGIYDIFMTLNSNNRAYAVISGLYPGKLIYNGHLERVSDSGVFKGYNTI